MGKITIENIVLQGRQICVNKKIRHPFIYPNGTVDLSALPDKKLKELNGKSDKVIISEVWEYLQHPRRYVNNCIPLNPQYL